MIVIYNPTAGRRRVSLLWRVLDVLVAHGVRLEVMETRHAGHAREIARDVSGGQALVVAAGGDGTIAEVASGLSGGRAPLGILPLGTANVLAHELGLPADPTGLAAVLVSGRHTSLWPGIARGPSGERLFVQMLGVGFDAHVVHHVSRPLKRILGKGAYVAQTLRELPRYGFAPIRLRIDGIEAVAGSVIIAKGRLYGGPYLLAPEARCDRPGFSVMLFEQAGIAPALIAGAALPLGRLGQVPGVVHCRASRIELLPDAALPAQADGDPAGTTPLLVEDAPLPIRVATGGVAGAGSDRAPMRLAASAAYPAGHDRGAASA